MKVRFSRFVAVLLTLCFLPFSAFSAVIFPFTPNAFGINDSRAIAVSGDGRSVVGQITYAGNGRHAVSYSNGVVTSLGDFHGGGFLSWASDTTADGNVVVGSSSTTYGTEAFVHEDSELRSLGLLRTNDSSSYARGVSADGSVIVGGSSSRQGSEAFVYRNGVMTGLGHLPGSNRSSATAISADGSIIVGNSSQRYHNRSDAFVIQDGNMLALGDLDGGRYWTEATDISGDGRVIVGNAQGEFGQEAFFYQDGIMLGLGGAAEGAAFRSVANGVSYDGSTIVGVVNGIGGEHASVWTKTITDTYDLIRLDELLLLYDVDVEAEGWERLTSAMDVSDDGSVIVGFGTRDGIEQAFVVDLTPVPLPGALSLLITSVLTLGLMRCHFA